MVMGCIESLMMEAEEEESHKKKKLLGNREKKKEEDVDDRKAPNEREVDKSHFLFHRAIGVGGFGVVLFATKKTHPEMGKHFAIKTLSKTSVLQRKSGLGSIFSELNLLKSIRHVFICNAHYAFQDESCVYLVLDLAKGGDLRYNMNANGGKLHEETAKFYIAQVILALEYLHEVQVIHRDVKPENILLNDDGYIKLTDFGVSKRLNEEGYCRSTSGTHGYMAPEMYISPQYAHDSAADWFAVGVTLFELLIGQRPFDVKTLKGNQCREMGPYQLHVGFVSPRQGSELSYECQHFLRSLLAAPPERRLKGKTKTCSSKHSSSRYEQKRDDQLSPYVRDHPWLRRIKWEMLYYRALPVPFIPDSVMIRSCLSPADAMALMKEHRKLKQNLISKSAQEAFSGYHYRNHILSPDQRLDAFLSDSTQWPRPHRPLKPIPPPPLRPSKAVCEESCHCHLHLSRLQQAGVMPPPSASSSDLAGMERDSPVERLAACQSQGAFQTGRPTHRGRRAAAMPGNPAIIMLITLHVKLSYDSIDPNPLNWGLE